MAWIRYDDEYIDHPKIEPLSDSAFRWWKRAKAYCNKYRTDGLLLDHFLTRVPPDVVAELRIVRPGFRHALWEERRGQLWIHDYLDYQPSKKELEKNNRDNRARQKRFRDRIRADAARQLELPDEPGAPESNAVSNTITDSVTNGPPARPSPAQPGTPNSRTPLPPSGEGGGARPARVSTRKATAREQQWAEEMRRNARGCPHRDELCTSAAACEGRLIADRRKQQRSGMSVALQEAE